MDGYDGSAPGPAYLLTRLSDGAVLSVSRAALSLLGLEQDEVLGRTSVELGLWRDEGQRNSFLSCLDIEGNLVRYPVAYLRRDGVSADFVLSAERLSSPGGEDLLVRLVRLLPEARLYSGRTDLVRFLSRSATKFLVEGEGDLFRTIAEELGALLPNSIVAVYSRSGEPPAFQLRAHAMPSALERRFTGQGEPLPAVPDEQYLDFPLEDLTCGRFREMRFREPQSAKAGKELRSLLLALDAVSSWRMGLSWDGRVYGFVAVTLLPPDAVPDFHALETFVRQASAALQRNEHSRALAASLEEKETLLREVHHRVKNNLQIVASLLRLQGAALKDPESVHVLAEAADRVHAMALVHTMLYDNKNLATVDAASFIRTLATQIIRSGRFDPASVALGFELEAILLDPDRAIPLGLIVNELLTNALKYGVPPPVGGSIRLSLRREAPALMVLEVADSGGRLPLGFDPEESATLGMQLVANLARQIGGKLAFSAGRETAFRVFFSA